LWRRGRPAARLSKANPDEEEDEAAADCIEQKERAPAKSQAAGHGDGSCGSGSHAGTSELRLRTNDIDWNPTLAVERARPSPFSANIVMRRRMVTAACMMAIFMAAVEVTIVATAMPTIVADLGGARFFSWVFAAYLLTQAVTTPIYGRLADIYGRKRVFVAGSSLFLIGSVACGFTWSMVSLVVFRTIQGLGAGCIQSVATTIVGDVYTASDRARVQGWLSAVWALAAIIGPILGAFIVEHLHWAFVFWINLPIGVVAIGLLCVFLNEELDRRQHQIDYLGSLLLMLGLGATMTVVIQAQSLGPFMAALLIGVGLGALAWLVVQESDARRSLLFPSHFCAIVSLPSAISAV
jgi:multidrug resistance protein